MPVASSKSGTDGERNKKPFQKTKNDFATKVDLVAQP